jgi:uncharacterized membrane protein YidH (DUF202 family)
MSDPMQDMQPEVIRTLFTLRAVFGAMIAGVVIFGAVVFFALRPEPGEGDTSVLLASLAVLAVALTMAWVVVGRILRQSLRHRMAEARHDEAAAVLHRGFFSVSLVGGAMGEAYCFFAIAVYMLTASPLALLAAGLGLAALAVQLPTADRCHRFAEEIKGNRPS